MKVKELKQIIGFLSKADLEELEVVVKIHGIYNTEPSVKIISAYTGFDWGHGKFMLVPEKELTEKEETP